MAYVRRWAEKPERAVVSSSSGEQQDGVAHRGVIAVAAPSGAVRSRPGLAFPVDQVAADGVVAVAGRRRKVATGLVECECEQIGACVFCEVHAFAPRWGSRVPPLVER